MNPNLSDSSTLIAKENIAENNTWFAVTEHRLTALPSLEKTEENGPQRTEYIGKTNQSASDYLNSNAVSFQFLRRLNPTARTTNVP